MILIVYLNKVKFKGNATDQMKGTIVSSKSYRYFTYGDPKIAKHLIYVLHGYGQLAAYFIRKFHFLSDEYFIVAPEGMHRFYLKENSGKVGASWMTKEDREVDISENIKWLDQLDQEISSKNSFEKKMILGFSQGGATATRWFYKGNIIVDHLIIWASVFPPDLEIEKELNFDEKGNNYFFIGNSDEYYSKDQQKELLEQYKSKGFVSELYEGNHAIHSEILQKLLDLL